MTIELDKEEIFELLNEWCKKEHGTDIKVLFWYVEEDMEFNGARITT